MEESAAEVVGIVDIVGSLEVELNTHNFEVDNLVVELGNLVDNLADIVDIVGNLVDIVADNLADIVDIEDIEHIVVVGLVEVVVVAVEAFAVVDVVAGRLDTLEVVVVFFLVVDHKLGYMVDDIVEARLSELFELINRELKRIKRQANLPGGAVLTGGGANLRGIVDYARVALQMNARVYKPQNYKGVTEQIRDAGWTTALGLLEYSAESGIDMGNGSGAEHRGLIGGLIAKIGGLFNRKSN